MFRRFLGTWAARAFFLVLVGSFALWGVADVVRNFGHDTALATVGERKIEVPEFQEMFRQQLAQVSRMLGGRTEPTPQIRQAVAGQVLDRMVVQAALAEQVRRMRLVVPDDALRQAVFEIPAFRGPAGSFDRNAFNTVLRNNGLTEPRFLDLMRQDLALQQLVQAVQAGAAPPKLLQAEVYGFQRETRVAELVELPFLAAPEPPAPTAEDLQRLYENNPAAYSAPEFRRIKAVVLSPDTLARDVQVTEDELRTYYEAHKAEYVSAEKRSAEIVTVPDEAKAKALATTWITGDDWAAMQKAAADAGGAATTLDDAAKAEFPTAELGDTVFATGADTVSSPIQTPFGWQVVRVTKVAPGTFRSLDDVKDEIRGRVARDRATDLVYARANELDKALSADTKLDDLPGDLGLAAVAGTLDKNGNTASGEPAPIPGTPALRQAIVTAAFALQKNEPPRLTEAPDQSYFALVVEDTTAAALKPFAEVQDQLRRDWEHDSRRRAQEQVAAKLLAAVNAGGSLDDAAVVAGLHVERTPPVARSTPTDGVPRELVQPLFGLKLHQGTMVETPDGFLVARLDEINTPDPAADPIGAAQMRTSLAQALGQDVEALYAVAIRARANPRVNRQLLDSVAQ